MGKKPRFGAWIGGSIRSSGGKSVPLVSPIDETAIADIVDSDAGVIDEAVTNAHAAFLTYRDATVATRMGWLNGAADAIEKTEPAILESLVRAIGKPRRAAAFEAKRGPQFLRAELARARQFTLDHEFRHRRLLGF